MVDFCKMIPGGFFPGMAVMTKEEAMEKIKAAAANKEVCRITVIDNVDFHCIAAYDGMTGDGEIHYDLF